MIEVHVGIPKGAMQPNLFSGFEWSTVYDTVAGPSIDREYLGHSVEGRLGTIGTARPTVDINNFVIQTAFATTKIKGSRLEIEAIDEDIYSAWSRLRPATSLLEDKRILERIPAPLYERHIKIRNGQSPEELRSFVGSLLMGYMHFELTIFGPENTKAIVTVGANTKQAIADQTNALHKAFTGQPIEVGPLEAIIGAWRPILARPYIH